ncbi:hypothetical protein M413DRAFT_352379 [Hebeloma cylindrosporum]|uniref:Uncharacterized protein n=1 Tax=Hebeloma cylindrosporum TaxID=76867 RepID=A0A0C3CKT8_HEBCY|nr:hypothetical protein M413DRAFT_352379 [Hebeloma cylindrosporum h7]
MPANKLRNRLCTHLEKMVPYIIGSGTTWTYRECPRPVRIGMPDPHRDATWSPSGSDSGTPVRTPERAGESRIRDLGLPRAANRCAVFQ